MGDLRLVLNELVCLYDWNLVPVQLLPHYISVVGLTQSEIGVIDFRQSSKGALEARRHIGILRGQFGEPHLRVLRIALLQALTT